MAAYWDLRRLQQYLDKYPPTDLYLIFGEEMFLTDEALSLLKEKTLTGGATDFNCDLFYAKTNTAAQVRDAAETLPVMSDRRLVIFKGVHDLSDSEWEQLYPVLESPIESATLVLVGEKVDKRKKYFKKIQAKGTLVELKKPYDNQLAQWVEYVAHRCDIKLEPEALALIQQLVGNNLSEIRQEMEKLKCYMGEESKEKLVTPGDVLKVVSHAKIDSVFDLTNAIGRRDRAAALTHLANLLDHGENEVAVLSLILRHIRILSDLKHGIRQGLNGARLSAKAGIPNYFLKQYQSQVNSWEARKIDKTLEVLHKTDRALKTSPVSSHIWLENFIIQSCS